MATKKGETISRLRDAVKGASQDAFLTDRFIYSLALKYAKLYIKREDDKMMLAKYKGLFETIPCMELEEVSTIDPCCAEILTCCTVRRTKERVPPLIEGSFGAIFGLISSIDGSQILNQTYSSTYTRMTKSTSFKYNKELYYFFDDGYLYFPNIEWDAVAVEGLWEDGIQMFLCDGDKCLPKQDEQTSIPEFLFAEIENNVKQELLTMMQIPKQTAVSDNQSTLKN